MKKVYLGILLGIIAGIIDVTPMVAQNLTWDANLSAFSLWVVSGFLIASSNLKISGALKGLLISFLIAIPALFLIGWNAPLTLVPIIIMTTILGSVLGYLIEKYGK
jgi:hypothetical protein